MSLESIVTFCSSHAVELTAVQQALFSFLSGLCALVGWTKASKILGTFTALDLGRAVRYMKLGIEARKAIMGASLLVVLVFALGCAGPSQTTPLVCPIPASTEVVQKAEQTAQKVEQVTKDPELAGLIIAADQVLDTIGAGCPAIPSDEERAGCVSKVADARALLARADADRAEICAGVRFAAVLVPVPTDVSVVLDRVCPVPTVPPAPTVPTVPPVPTVQSVQPEGGGV